MAKKKKDERDRDDAETQASSLPPGRRPEPSRPRR